MHIKLGQFCFNVDCKCNALYDWQVESRQPQGEQLLWNVIDLLPSLIKSNYLSSVIVRPAADSSFLNRALWVQLFKSQQLLNNQSRTAKQRLIFLKDCDCEVNGRMNCGGVIVVGINELNICHGRCWSHFQTFIRHKSVKQSAQTLDMRQQTELRCA